MKARKLQTKPIEPSALIACKAEASRIGWPLQFATDLSKHDADAITAMLPRQPFTWCLRISGTHLGRFVGKPEHTLRMTDVCKAFGVESCRFYVWDGQALVAMSTARDADDRLAELGRARFRVQPRRLQSSFVTCSFPTRREADECAIAWEKRYGEDFITVDTWEVK